MLSRTQYIIEKIIMLRIYDVVGENGHTFNYKYVTFCEKNGKIMNEFIGAYHDDKALIQS